MAQTIPNSEFQEWISEGNFENPEFWSTSNSVLLTPVSKSTDAYSDDYSARLETKDVPLLGLQIPGIITLAEINIVFSPPSYSISGGLFLQENVSKLTGMYKYDGIEGDSATVLIYNFKHDEGSNFDTIGYGVAYLQDASSWTSFTVNMQIINSHIPDTFNVVLMSSSSPDFTTGAGSVLLVDNIEIETNTGIINFNEDLINVKVYPNPVTEYVEFETTETQNGRMLNIYDLGGNLIITNNFSSIKTKVDIIELPSALYTYSITKHNQIIKTGSFIKK
jgi:hypothetical protein